MTNKRVPYIDLIYIICEKKKVHVDDDDTTGQDFIGVRTPAGVSTVYDDDESVVMSCSKWLVRSVQPRTPRNSRSNLNK